MLLQAGLRLCQSWEAPKKPTASQSIHRYSGFFTGSCQWTSAKLPQPHCSYNQVMLLLLTVLCREEKLSKYSMWDPLVTAHRLVVEQGICSLLSNFYLLSIKEAERRRAVCSSTEVAERASRWLWLKRREHRANFFLMLHFMCISIQVVVFVCIFFI